MVAFARGLYVRTWNVGLAPGLCSHKGWGGLRVSHEGYCCTRALHKGGSHRVCVCTGALLKGLYVDLAQGLCFHEGWAGLLFIRAVLAQGLCTRALCTALHQGCTCV